MSGDSPCAPGTPLGTALLGNRSMLHAAEFVSRIPRVGVFPGEGQEKLNSVENPLFLSLGWGCLERGEMGNSQRGEGGTRSGIRLQPHKCYFCVMFLCRTELLQLSRGNSRVSPLSCIFPAVLGLSLVGFPCLVGSCSVCAVCVPALPVPGALIASQDPREGSGKSSSPSRS